MDLAELKKRWRYLRKGDVPAYRADGMTLVDKNLGFLSEPRFATAWEKAREGGLEGWARGVPDIQWRAHIACWAASNVLHLEGDFVEFGVHTGLLSTTICHHTGFDRQPRKFWLFDTYAGIPEHSSPDDEKKRAAKHNSMIYQNDVFEHAKRNFAPFPNAILVRGELPGTIDGVPIEKIAYLSVDLNSAFFEKASVERIWDRVVDGAHIVLDDYAWRGHENQYEMWNAFAAERGQRIATLPTGQGLMVKRLG